MGNQEQNAKKKFYKKWWFWALLVLVIIIIASASKDKPQKVGDNSGITVADTAQSQTPAVPESFKIGDQVKMGSSIITVNKVEYSQGGQYSKPTEGNEWVNLNVTIENTGSSQQYVTTLGQMFIRDAGKNSYQISATNKLMENPGFGLDGQVLANSKRTGWVGFEIPKTSTGLQFQYNASMFGGKEVLINLDR